MSKKQLEIAMAEEQCKLANQRFGLEKLCETLLIHSSFRESEVIKAIKLAKNREFEPLNELLESRLLKPK